MTVELGKLGVETGAVIMSGVWAGVPEVAMLAVVGMVVGVGVEVVGMDGSESGVGTGLKGLEAG